MNAMASALKKVGLVTQDQIDKHEKHKKYVHARTKELNKELEKGNDVMKNLNDAISKIHDIGGQVPQETINTRNLLTKKLSGIQSELERLEKSK